MLTSRGIRLALLAARGQLNHKIEDISFIIALLKDRGISLEIFGEYHKMLTNVYANGNQIEAAMKEADRYLNLLDPDIANKKNDIFEEAKKRLSEGGQIMTVKTSGKAIQGAYKYGVS